MIRNIKKKIENTCHQRSQSNGIKNAPNHAPSKPLKEIFFANKRVFGKRLRNFH